MARTDLIRHWTGFIIMAPNLNVITVVYGGSCLSANIHISNLKYKIIKCQNKRDWVKTNKMG